MIDHDRSIIVAPDVTKIDQFKKTVKATYDVEGIGGYKIGFGLTLPYRIEEIVKVARKYTKKPIINDHQKACTDVPHTGELFATIMDESKIDAAILFPRENDEVTQYMWTKSLQKKGVGVLVGAELTSRPATKETEQVYWNAVFQGVTNFVVPGNKPERVEFYRKKFEDFGIEASLFAPGFVDQGGEITKAGEVAGERFHAIVGRGIINPNKKKNILDVTVEEMHEAAKQMTSQII